MSVRRSFVFAVCIALGLALGAGTLNAGVRAMSASAALAAATVPPADVEARSAAAFVDRLADRAIRLLTEPGISDEQRRVRFRVLFRAHFDVPAIARFVLGRYWRLATPDEREQYLGLFEGFMVAVYADRFRDYSGRRLAVTGVRRDGPGDAVVHSEVLWPGSGAPVRLDWRLMAAGGGWRVHDLLVEGVSMAAVQRADFANVIQAGGGRVSALLAALRRRTGEAAGAAAR